jgi:hypothetical protein
MTTFLTNAAYTENLTREIAGSDRPNRVPGFILITTPAGMIEYRPAGRMTNIPEDFRLYVRRPDVKRAVYDEINPDLSSFDLADGTVDVPYVLGERRPLRPGEIYTRFGFRPAPVAAAAVTVNPAVLPATDTPVGTDATDGPTGDQTADDTAPAGTLPPDGVPAPETAPTDGTDDTAPGADQTAPTAPDATDGPTGDQTDEPAPVTYRRVIRGGKKRYEPVDPADGFDGPTFRRTGSGKSLRYVPVA